MSSETFYKAELLDGFMWVQSVAHYCRNDSHKLIIFSHKAAKMCYSKHVFGKGEMLKSEMWDKK